MTTERDKRNIAYTYWAEGKEAGLVQGREEGREEGKSEAMSAIAKRLASMGLDKTGIAKATGLSEPEITLILGRGKGL